MEELHRAYDDGLVDPRSIAWEDVEHTLALGKDGAMRERHRDPELFDFHDECQINIRAIPLLAALNIVRADFSTPATGRLEKINARHVLQGDHP